MIPASPPPGAYRNDSEDAKSRFFKFKQHGKCHARKYLCMTFSHGCFFNDGSSLWLLKSMPRMHGTTSRSVLTISDLPIWSFLQFIGSSVILSIRSVSKFRSCEICLCRFGVWTIQKLYFWCVDFAAAGTLHCKLSLLNWILEASIVFSQGVCVSKLEVGPLHSRLHLRHVGCYWL